MNRFYAKSPRGPRLTDNIRYFAEVFGAAEHNGHHCIIFEHCETTLYDVLCSVDGLTPLPRRHIQEISYQLIQGVACGWCALRCHIPSSRSCCRSSLSRVDSRRHQTGQYWGKVCRRCHDELHGCGRNIPSTCRSYDVTVNQRTHWSPSSDVSFVLESVYWTLAGLLPWITPTITNVLVQSDTGHRKSAWVGDRLAMRMLC